MAPKINSKVKITFIITDLKPGGAQIVLLRLIDHINKNRFQISVISLLKEGSIKSKIESLGVPVFSSGISKSMVSWPFGFFRLFNLLKFIKPDVVSTWMYHADLIGGLIARIAGVRAVSWGIRHSNFGSGKTSSATRYVAYFSALFSYLIPKAIISCSTNAVSMHQELGYKSDKFTLIPNGYNLNTITFREKAAVLLRNEWNIAPEIPLLGMVARWNPQKDHANLLSSLAILNKKKVKFICVLVGTGMEDSNTKIKQLIEYNNLLDKVLLVGPQENIPDVMSAIDIHILSSSYGEAFPNVVAEAMACSTPCVVTDVGDAALIVGNTGWVVPPNNSIALSTAIENSLLDLKSEYNVVRKRLCRQRIEKKYSIEHMAKAYHKVWRNIIL